VFEGSCAIGHSGLEIFVRHLELAGQPARGAISVADDKKLGRRREGASSLVICCTSNAGHRDKILLACPAHSYVGMSSTVTNVRTLQLSVARQHQH
jgi:hypothetical protein